MARSIALLTGQSSSQLCGGISVVSEGGSPYPCTVNILILQAGHGAYGVIRSRSSSKIIQHVHAGWGKA